MRTMHPVLMVGYHGWDRDRLPEDEYGERRRAVRSTMAERGLDGLVIHGDCDEASLVTYLTNFFPRNRWGICLLAREGDPVLLVAGGTRDLPAAADQTWLKGVGSFGHVDRALPDWAAGIDTGGRPLRLGLVGFGTMRPPVHAAVTAALPSGAELVDAGAAFAALLATKRPREIEMIRQSCALLDDAAATLAGAAGSGATDAQAAIAAERAARLAAAHDVRMMIGFDGGRTLEPFFEMRPGRSTPLAAYLAVRRVGYWAAGFVTVGSEGNAADAAVRAALAAMVDGIRPGMSGRDLRALGEPHLAGLAPHPMLGGVVAHGIGLGLDENPILEDASDAAIERGGVYSVQVGLRDAEAGVSLRSSMVRVTGDGHEMLWAGEGAAA